MNNNLLTVDRSGAIPTYLAPNQQKLGNNKTVAKFQNLNGPKKGETLLRSSTQQMVQLNRNRNNMPAAGAGPLYRSATGAFKSKLPVRKEKLFVSTQELAVQAPKSDLDVSILVAQTYKIGKIIGNGNFGELRLGKNIYTNENVALKFEEHGPETPLLPIENKFYRRLLPHEGIPKLYFYGQFNTKYNVLAMELLGSNLEDLFALCQRKFSLKTICMIAIQLLQRIEYVHSKNIVYRDVKPDNFLIGKIANNRHHLIHIIDFGLAKEYINSTSGQHIAYKENKSLTGTARYMSIHTHLGREQSRRDDIEGIAHVLIYFLRGKLPWQGLKGGTETERYNKIGEIKQSITIDELCASYPREFADLLRYSRSLGFYEVPDYKRLIKSFEDLIKSRGWSIDWNFDWIEKIQKLNKTNTGSA